MGWERGLAVLRYFRRVDVQCYAGYRGEQEPRGFDDRGCRVEVAEIIDRWLDPNHRYFKVKGKDGEVYLLRHDVKAGIWELRISISSGDPPPHTKP